MEYACKIWTWQVGKFISFGFNLIKTYQVASAKWFVRSVNVICVISFGFFNNIKHINIYMLLFMCNLRTYMKFWIDDHIV